MRLVCPNCGAEYDVADEAIPASGRDVQCSNCGHGWFASRDAAPEQSAETEKQAEPSTQEDPAQPAPAPYHGLDPEVAAILQEEADREARAREAEHRAALETQTEMALADAPTGRKVTVPESARVEIRPAPEDYVASPTAGVADNEALPDIDRLNSSLRGEEVDFQDGFETLPPEVSTTGARRGVRLGFWLILLCAIGLAATYYFAPQITDALPQSEPILDRYVGFVNEIRIWLDDTFRPLLTQ
jgi:predicted Zn finger-like uncharacterized protein